MKLKFKQRTFTVYADILKIAIMCHCSHILVEYYGENNEYLVFKHSCT
jgi:hypothetical protein